MKLKNIFLIALFAISACQPKEKNQENLEANNKATFIASDNSPSVSYVIDNSAKEDQCRDILSKGVMNEFKFKSKKDYTMALRKAITLDDEQIRKSKKSSDISGEIGIKILSLGFGSTSSDEEYLKLKKKYTDNSTLDISDTDLQQIEIRIADPTIVQAWSDCMGGKSKGLTYKIHGDRTKEFTVQIQYIPASAYDPKALTISNFTISKNLKASGNNKFKAGLKIPQYGSVSQQFTRLNKEIATIVTDSRYRQFAITLEKVEVAKPEPEFEEIWTKYDEFGNLYKQVFYAGTPECHDCSDKPQIIWSKIETLENKSGRIYQVERACSGEGCGWNYSAAPDAYGIVYHILEGGNQFWFERRIGGRACTEINTAYYEVKRKVPKNKI